LAGHQDLLTAPLNNSSWYPRGALVGQVNMVGCVKAHPSPFFFGEHGFVFERPIEFSQPIPYKGKLGIFYVPDHLVPIEA